MTQRDTNEESAQELQRLGRGAIFLTFTKLWFLVSGYAVVAGLAVLFGKDDAGVATFGDYRTVTTLVSIVNAFVVFGTQQAVSRFVARHPEEGDGVRRAAYRLQSLLGGGLFCALFFSAPFLAEGVYGDPGLTTPLRIASFITLFFAFYSVFMGYLNGTKQFAKQALADFAYSTGKAAFILSAAALLGSALGAVPAAVAGFAVAALAVLVLSRILAGPAKGPGTMAMGTLFRFQVFTMIFAGASAFVLQFDLHLLKIFGPGGDEGNVLVGFYGAAQQFATIPYQAVFAITFVLFPLVSGVAESDPERLKVYIRATTRYATMIATVIVALFCSAPERTLMVLFPERYAEGADVLRILVTGFLFYCPFAIQCAILNAAGKPRLSVGLILLLVVVQLAIGRSLVGFWEGQGVATGTAIGMIVAFLATQFVFARVFGQTIEIARFLRTLTAGLMIGLGNHFVFARATIVDGEGVLATLGGSGLGHRVVTVLGFGLLVAVYFVLLLVLRVLTSEDRQRLGALFARIKK